MEEFTDKRYPLLTFRVIISNNEPEFELCQNKEVHCLDYVIGSGMPAQFWTESAFGALAESSRAIR